MKAAFQLWRSPGVSLSHAKLMLQLHWGFKNLALSFLFAPLSCSLSLTICLPVSIKCRIKYLLACLWLHHLFLRGKELCAAVLQKEDKTKPGALANGDPSWLNLHNLLWILLCSRTTDTTHTLFLFLHTPPNYILPWIVIQHLSLVRVLSPPHH